MIFTKPNKENIKKYGKNMLYYAWTAEDVANNNICSATHKKLDDGRFCAVAGFIYAIINGKYCILANKRGSGTPDYQGCWNAPCGFLERYENSKEGIAREILEECGFQIDTNDLKIVYVETEPELCNKGNVSIRHIAFLGKITPHYVKRKDGEENEVDFVKWIPIDEIDNYVWAFNHLNVIKKYAPNKTKRKLIEFWYNTFGRKNSKYSITY